MQDAGTGLMGSLKRLLATLASIASTRLELLANELQEERLRLIQMFFFALLAVFCFCMGLLLLSLFVVVLFWDDHRLAVLGSLAALYLGSGFWAGLLFRGKIQEKSKLFSASLAELAKDKQQLGARHE